MLSVYFSATGADISPVQIALERSNVPDAIFLLADIAEVEFPNESFGAVSAFYSIIPVPRGLQPGLLEKIAGCLQVGVSSGRSMPATAPRTITLTGSEFRCPGAGAESKITS